MKTADQLLVDDILVPYSFTVTPELNRVYCDAVDDSDPRYNHIIQPALLFNQSNATRSPSFWLAEGMAAVHAFETTEFFSPCAVGNRVSVSWEVVDRREKYGRVFQTRNTWLFSNSRVLMHRLITDVYVWLGDGKAVATQRPKILDHQGIHTGPSKVLTAEKMSLFSGGSIYDADWPKKNIHTDRDFAQRCGLPAPIASGAMTIGYLTELMISLCGERWLHQGTQALKLVAAVFAGDTVRAMSAGSTVWCENQHGNPVVLGTMGFRNGRVT